MGWRTCFPPLVWQSSQQAPPREEVVPVERFSIVFQPMNILGESSFWLKSQLPPRPSKNYSELVIWCCDDIFQRPNIGLHLQISLEVLSSLKAWSFRISGNGILCLKSNWNNYQPGIVGQLSEEWGERVYQHPGDPIQTRGCPDFVNINWNTKYTFN